MLDGRLPQASPDPDVIEIVLRDDFQREVDVPIGHEVPGPVPQRGGLLPLRHWFEGGEVHGPEAVLQVVGTIRMAGGFSTTPPAFASGAALESHPEAFIGTSYFVRLDGRRRRLRGVRRRHRGPGR